MSLARANALAAVQKFRTRELKGLETHVKRFGPLQCAPAFSNDTLTTKIPGSATLVNYKSKARLPNPFLPRFNPQTGRWAPPKYSLRRQADVVKKAKLANVTHLLPSGPKLTQPLLFHQTSNKALVKGDVKSSKIWDIEMKDVQKPGASIGSRLYSGKKTMFKGHKWERTHASRQSRQKMLMRDMKKRVERYKAYYQRRKPNPLKPARSAKAPKLPF